MEELCRTCLCSNQVLYAIFDGEYAEVGANINIAMMLTECTKYKVDSSDDLPQRMCSACISSVQAAYAFKRKCEDSYLKLLDLLHQSHQHHLTTRVIKNELIDIEEVALETMPSTHVDSKGIEDDSNGMDENVDNTDDNNEDNKHQLTNEFLQVFLDESCVDNKETIKTEDRDESAENGVSYDMLSTGSLPTIPQCNKVQRKHRARIVGLLKCDDCDKMFTNAGLRSHKINRHGEKSHICEFCQKGFRTKIHLKRHIVVHSKKRFICKVCSTGYDTKEELDEHIKIENHNKSKLCPICGLRYKTNWKLKEHMRQHTGEKPYKCTYCNKGFPRNQELRTHERSHTGEKTHFCNVCGKGFQKKCYRDKHLHVHDSKDKQTVCPRCKQKYPQSNDLKAHICTNPIRKEYIQPNISVFENLDIFG